VRPARNRRGFGGGTRWAGDNRNATLTTAARRCSHQPRAISIGNKGRRDPIDSVFHGAPRHGIDGCHRWIEIDRISNGGAAAGFGDLAAADPVRAGTCSRRVGSHRCCASLHHGAGVEARAEVCARGERAGRRAASIARGDRAAATTRAAHGACTGATTARHSHGEARETKDSSHGEPARLFATRRTIDYCIRCRCCLKVGTILRSAGHGSVCKGNVQCKASA
jgi:hypothetical protein